MTRYWNRYCRGFTAMISFGGVLPFTFLGLFALLGWGLNLAACPGTPAIVWSALILLGPWWAFIVGESVISSYQDLFQPSPLRDLFRRSRSVVPASPQTPIIHPSWSVRWLMGCFIVLACISFSSVLFLPLLGLSKLLPIGQPLHDLAIATIALIAVPPCADLLIIRIIKLHDACLNHFQR